MSAIGREREDATNLELTARSRNAVGVAHDT
jgi:hypothetical protein